MRMIYSAVQLIWVFLLTSVVWGYSTDTGIMRSLKQVHFMSQDIPCLLEFVEAGDPDRGPSTLILKAPPHCVIPWHIHHAQEQLMVVTGQVLAEMAGMMPAHILKTGGFALMPGGMKHQFTCQSKSNCLLFVAFNQKYDLCYINKCPDPLKPCRICKERS